MADISQSVTVAINPDNGSKLQVKEGKPAPPVRRSSLVPDKAHISGAHDESCKVSKAGKPAPPIRNSSMINEHSDLPSNDNSEKIVLRRPSKGEKPLPPNRVSSLNPKLTRQGSLQYINPGWSNSQRERQNSDSSVESNKNISTIQQQNQQHNSPPQQNVMVAYHQSPQERKDFIEKEFEKINEILQMALSQL